MGVLASIFRAGAAFFGPTATAVATKVPGAAARGAQATGRAALTALRAPAVTRTLPFLGAAGAGAIVGGTLLDDVNPTLAQQLRAMGFDPARLTPRRKAPELIFDPQSGQTFRRVKKRRSRGISATELRGFRRVTDLLVDVGLAPRKIPTAAKESKKRRK